ncbi:reverse transcriptase domain-containing protein [Tanacetum coccineum]
MGTVRLGHILVIVDDYSRYTWVYFLHSKDETPEIIKKFIAQAQLNYKAKVCKIRTDNDAPPPLPTSAPTSLPPLLLPSASRREDRPEVNLPPRERLGIALGPSYEVGESFAAAVARPAGGLRADYGFVATMDREIRRDPERYGKSMDASDLARAKVMSLHTIVHAQMSEITELQSADRSRRRAISDLLETDRRRHEEMRELRAADRTRQQQIIQTLTGQVTALQGQQGPAGGPAQPELPEEADSSS